jgi:hypothetical protein
VRLGLERLREQLCHHDDGNIRVCAERMPHRLLWRCDAGIKQHRQ